MKINDLRAIPMRFLILMISGIVGYLIIVAAGGVTQCPTSGNVCLGDDRSEVFILAGLPTAPTTTNITYLDAGGGNDRVTVSSIITTPIVIYGRDGNDAIFDGGGGTSNSLNGDDGNDRIDGNGGNDIINGGLGNDQLNGGIGNDTINGHEGNDRILGGPGTDTIDAGPGNDLIDPGPDTDPWVTGGGGNDVYVLRRGEAGNGIENIWCTTASGDRSVVRLVGFSKDDPALPRLPARLQPYSSVDILDGDINRIFRIYAGPGTCMVVAASQ
jgi:hypothetical protein